MQKKKYRCARSRIEICPSGLVYAYLIEDLPHKAYKIPIDDSVILIMLKDINNPIEHRLRDSMFLMIDMVISYVKFGMKTIKKMKP